MFRENQCKVLIVIADKELRELILHNLKKTTFHIFEANPQNALELLESNNPNLLILDVADEQSENLKITEEIKQNKRFDEINVLQISPESLFNETGIIDKFECHADVYFAQPFNPHNLILMLRALLQYQDRESDFKKNENRYRAVADANSQLVFSSGDFNHADNNLLKWWKEATGQSLDAVRGWGWLSAVHPEDRDLAQTAWQYAFDNLTECEIEYRVRAHDGQYRYLSVRGIPILNASGKLSEWVVTAKEVTKDREIENLLSQQNALLELSHEPIFVWDIDKGIINWNRGCEELYGFTKTDAIGEMSHKLLRTKFPISFENYRESLEKDGSWTGELRHLSRNNREIIVESRQIFVTNPGSGQSLVLESNRDITEREQNEFRLRASEERYRAFIKQSSEGIWRAELEEPISIDLSIDEQIDLFYKYAYIAECNDAMAQMYGLESAANLNGARIGDLIVREDPKNYEYFRDFIVSNYRLTESETHEKQSDGTDVYFLNNLIGIVENKHLMRAWGTQRDITVQRTMEKALRESDERFRQLAENLDDVFWVRRWREGKAAEIEYVSPAIERLWGIKPEFVRENKENWMLFIHPDDLEQTEEESCKILSNGKFEAEYRIVLPSNQIRWVHDWGVAIHDANGNIERTVGSAKDITERREIANVLKETEERMRLAMQAADMFTWEIDLLTEHFEWSENAERILDFLPNSLPHNLQSAFTLVPQEDIEPIKQAFQSAIDENKTFTAEFRLINSQGKIVWLHSNGVFIRNATHEPIRFVGISQNITKRKIAEDEIWRLNQELQKRVAELQTLLDVLPIGVAIADDTSLKHISANHYLTETLGLPNESNISASNQNVNQNYGWQFFRDNQEIFPEDLPIQQAINSKKAIEFELDIQMKHKQPISFLANAAPLLDDNKEVRGAIAAFVDITERKRVESERDELLGREQHARREAEFANRAKDEFLAVLSHELRTPLNAMYGWVRMLSSGTLDSTMQKRAIEVIERNIQLQTKLIEDILDVSRIISGKIKLELRRLDLVSLINSVVEMSRPAASLKQITLETKLESEEPIAVLGDAERLQQVLSNLINNAIKFTPAGGQIILEVTRRENIARVSVIDNGAGIQPDFLPHVFDRFKQADSSSKRKHGGLGLGLAIVKHLVDLHRGSVAAQSLGEGMGATFIIELPLEAIEQTETEENKLNGPQAHHDLFENMRVLTVEDEFDASEMLDTLLSAHRAVVTSANSASEALEILQKDEFDLLISDIGMPEMDGLEFIRKLRADENARRKNLLAIALTAYVGADDRQRILAAGFNECLSKPIDFNNLQGAVAKFLNAGHNVNSQ